MDHATAIPILQRLAQGIHPATGEIFGADSPYNEPSVIRALFFAIEQLSRPRRGRADLPENHGRPWSEEDKRFAAEAFKEGAPPDRIAKTMKRTRGAIRSELIRQGLILVEND